MTILKIIDIEGIGPTYAKKLQSIGIKTSDVLLEKGKTSKDRKEIAEQSDISDKLILKWINMADLIRIKGVGEEYSELLEASGVDTVVELSNRNAENLQEKMQQVNEQKKLVRRPPTLNEVKKWIAQAKALPRAVEYSSATASATIIESDNEEDEEDLQELEDKIDKLQTKLSQLSVKLQTTQQTDTKLSESVTSASSSSATEISKQKGVLPKGFEPKTTTETSKPSRGTLPKGF